MRVALLLLVLLMLLLRQSSFCLAEQPPAVPSPMQVTVTSQNFKTTLHWNYPPVYETPRFIVEIKPYDRGRYENVSNCVNISAHFCDVSSEIREPSFSHWFRVKAVVGSRQSEYVESNEFILQKHGKIGPPKLNLSRDDDKIVVDIYHPAFQSLELLPSLYEACPDFTFWVSLRDRKNQSKENFLEDNCTTYKCRLYVPIPAEGSTYCITAEGHFCDEYMLGATAEESCIHVPLKPTLSAQYFIILCAIVLALSVAFTVYCGCRKLRKKDIKLPKSLVSVIRKLNTGSVMEPKLETKYISVIDFIPDQSVLPDNVEVTLLEVKPEVTPENSSEGASSVPLPEAPAKAEEGSAQEHTEEVSSDGEQNCNLKQSYFVSAGGQMDVCSNSSGPEVPAAQVQPTVLPSSCPKFSGYDKPHVPLHMLIDVGEEQPVFAYRPTD